MTQLMNLKKKLRKEFQKKKSNVINILHEKGQLNFNQTFASNCIELIANYPFTRNNFGTIPKSSEIFSSWYQHLNQKKGSFRRTILLLFFKFLKCWFIFLRNKLQEKKLYIYVYIIQECDVLSAQQGQQSLATL